LAVVVREKVSDMIAEVVLVVTSIVLALVAIVSTVLTLSMSRSARESAKFSEEAARASLRSVLVGVAGLRVAFAVNPVFESSDLYFKGIHLESTSTNLFVHGVRLDSFGYEHESPPTGEYREESELGEMLDLVDTSVHAIRASPFSLPLLLHATEAAQFELSAESAMPDVKEVTSLGVTVFYSLDGESSPRERFVQWEAHDSMYDS
jgi:hypothetical protein